MFIQVRLSGDGSPDDAISLGPFVEDIVVDEMSGKDTYLVWVTDLSDFRTFLEAVEEIGYGVHVQLAHHKLFDVAELDAVVQRSKS